MELAEIRRFATVSALALAAVGTSATAEAATTTNVPCTSTDLVDAISNAGSGDTLNLATHCTYTLDNSTGPLPPVNVSLTIHGNGSTIQRDPGASPFRILTVNNDFQLDRVALRNGDATTSPGGFGGAVAVSTGTTKLNRVAIQNNTGTFSGGLGGLAGATVNVWNSVIQRNSATNNGGGAANDGTMTFSHTIINSNHAGQKGGGVASGGTLRIARSVVNGNRADNVGGGIANVGSGTATIAHSVVNGNRAANRPGGIDNEAGAGAVTLTRSIVRGNRPSNCAPTPVPGCSH